MNLLTNDQRKQVARSYYEAVSANDIMSARMSGKFKGTVVLKVFNPTSNTEGNIWIAFNQKEDIVALCSEIGTHGTGKLSSYLN